MSDFRRGQICGVDNCRSKRYILGDDGYEYCSRGHQVEGRVLTQEEEFGVGGTVGQVRAKTRRKPEKEEEVQGTILQGAEAVEMYLLCFQLILRKQIHWLVHTMEYPEELETVIHDLWSLRLSMLNEILDDRKDEDGTRVFSTQGTDSEQEAESLSHSRRFQEQAPLLIETLALCYLGIMLLRLPICFQDIHNWVLSEHFVYLKARHEVPDDMRQRLPISLRKKIYAQTGPAKLEQFHETVSCLAKEYNGLYGMEFPAISYNLLLFRFVSELSLPLDVFHGVDCLKDLLGYTLSMPTYEQKYVHISLLPEVELLTLLVVITKLLHPFDSLERNPRKPTEPASLTMDWKEWNRARKILNEKRKQGGQHQAVAKHHSLLKTTEADVMKMSGQDMDEYMNWFRRNWLEDDETNLQRRKGNQADFQNAMFRMFPIASDEDGAARSRRLETYDLDTVFDSTDVQIRTETLKGVQSSLVTQKTITDSLVEKSDATDVNLSGSGHDNPRMTSGSQVRKDKTPSQLDDETTNSDDEADGDDDEEEEETVDNKTQILRPGSLYKHYRKPSDLPEIATSFFEEAAKLVGLDLETFIIAVFQVEMDVERWVRKERRRPKGGVGEDDEDEEEAGVEGAVNDREVDLGGNEGISDVEFTQEDL